MAGPFPGMDPFIESMGIWRSFHTSLITNTQAMLNRLLPTPYAAISEEGIRLLESERSGPSSDRYPDVSILREPGGPTGGRHETAVAVVEPVTLPLVNAEGDDLTERWIEIRHLPDMELVTVIEFLSPTNKTGPAREEYLAKRDRLLAQPVSLVEIDLLVEGRRVPLGGKLPPGDYFAFVARAGRRPDCDVYAWSVRRTLPTIPIPLRHPDPDVLLDLSEVAAHAWDEGPYRRLMARRSALDLPLSPHDRDWAEAIGGVQPAEESPGPGPGVGSE